MGGQSIYVDVIQPLLSSSIPIAPACEMDAEMDIFSSRSRNYEESFAPTFFKMANSIFRGR